MIIFFSKAGKVIATSNLIQKKSKKSTPLIKAISYLNKELQEGEMVHTQDLTYMWTL